MALANHAMTYESGNLARTLPQQEQVRAQRPAVRRKASNKGLIITGGIIWTVIMAFCLAQIYTSALVSRTTSEITLKHEALDKYVAQNQELESQVAQKESVNAVETWAAAHGMQRPTTTKKLTADPSAVAARPAAPADSTKPVTAKTGLWGSLMTALSHWTGGWTAAAGH